MAALKGSATLIQQLLEFGADASLRGGRYGYVLQAAARTGLPSILALILNAKLLSGVIDVNAEGGIYETALQATAKGDWIGELRFLYIVSRGRVLRQRTSLPRTTSAEKQDYLKVAKILIDRGAIIKFSVGRLGSPINAAASSGNLDMLRCLISQDANLKSSEPTILNLASEMVMDLAVS